MFIAPMVIQRTLDAGGVYMQSEHQEASVFYHFPEATNKYVLLTQVKYFELCYKVPISFQLLRRVPRSNLCDYFAEQVIWMVRVVV